MMNCNKIVARAAFQPGDWMHLGFKLSVLLKGINALCEILGGVLLLYLNPSRLNQLAYFLTRGELRENPTDFVANALLRYSHGFSAGTQLFGIVYLLSHGIIKCLLAYLLWYKKRWAYPLAIVSLLFFIGYQVWRYFGHPSAFLIVLTVLDAVMVFLTAVEYKRKESTAFKYEQ